MNQNLKILNIFNHYLGKGGEAQAVEAICQSLSKTFELSRCDFFSSDWVGSEAPHFFKQSLWMLRNPRSLQVVRESQESLRVDAWLVHNVLPVGSLAIYPEAKRLGIPVIQYIHNFRPFSVNGDLWVNGHLAPEGLSKNYWPEVRAGAWRGSHSRTAWLAALLLLSHALGWWRSITAWIAISEFMREKFISAGVPQEKIFTLRHFWKPQPAGSEGSDGKHYLFLGRLIEAKGIIPLLNAWEVLERDTSKSAPRLVIAGNGPLRGEIERRAARMNSVCYAGELDGDSKDQAIQQARALIVPSVWWEPLGLVIYEAYDRCRPVLAAASGGVPEIVIEGQTGLLHQPGNAEQLAQQIRWMEANVRARREMGQRGRAWLEQNASETQWQEKFSKIAAHALAQRQ